MRFSTCIQFSLPLDLLLILYDWPKEVFHCHLDFLVSCLSKITNLTSIELLVAMQIFFDKQYLEMRNVVVDLIATLQLKVFVTLTYR